MVKDSFPFPEEIVEQNSEYFVGSLDVDSLFTNIPFEETIDICADTLFENTEKEEGFIKNRIKGTFNSCYERILLYFSWKALQASQWSCSGFTL